jgi:hypothetical protein
MGVAAHNRGNRVLAREADARMHVAINRMNRVADNVSTEDAVFAVAEMLLRGAILTTPTHTVGPYSTATDTTPRWACLDQRGEVVRVIEIEKHATGRYTHVETERHDWSPYGAAVAFVRLTSATDAMQAVEAKHW